MLQILSNHLKTDDKSYYYKGKEYKVLMTCNMKFGIWMPCVIYLCMYANPDGMIWVREREEFFNLFKVKEV